MGNLRALLLAVLLVPALLVGCGEQPSGDPGGTGGGTGGSAGGAGGGAGGGTVDAGSCSTPSDCPGVDTECRTRTCTSGVCGATNAPVTQVLGSQDAGDCQQRRCDGAGNVVSVADDADVPLDSNPCTRDVCAGGVVSHPGADAGTSCGDGGWVCDGAGSCGECNSVAQCAGADSECSARTCINHACGT